jgi:hypothetical protein
MRVTNKVRDAFQPVTFPSTASCFNYWEVLLVKHQLHMSVFRDLVHSIHILTFQALRQKKKQKNFVTSEFLPLLQH